MKRTAWVLVLVLFACGKKGDPTPPVPIIPKATTDLSVAQRGPDVVLRWSYPSLTSAGKKLESVDAILVYRYAEPLPENYATLKLPPVDPAQFNRTTEQIAQIERADLPSFVAGAQIIYTDRPPVRSESGLPLRYTYAVRTAGEEGRSAFSNFATIIALPSPPPPAELTANAQGAAVELSWKAPAEPPLAGYNVYRFPPVGEIDQLGTPLNSAPIADAFFNDLPPYGNHRYAVTAVASSGPPLIQSEPTNTVFVEFRDRVAPPAPASVVPLVEGGAVRLLWDPVQSPDLAGYRVYRFPASRERALLTPKLAEESNFRDPAPAAGASYSYGVSSVDTSGNESAVTESAAVFIPR